MSAGNGLATVDPAQCQRMHKWPLTLPSCSTSRSLCAGSGPSASTGTGAQLDYAEVPWLAGADGQTPVLPRTCVEVGSASAHGRVVTAGIHLSPCLTFLLDFSEHISGYKQFLWAARSEVGSHLLCKCYTWINTFLGLLNPSPLCVWFPADIPLASEASIFPESQQR